MRIFFKFYRRIQAQSLVELTTGLVVLIPVLMLFFDLALMVIAVQTNNNIARNAARVASMGSPLQYQSRAQASVNQAALSHNGPITKIVMVSATTNLTPTDITNWENSGGLVVHLNGSQTYPGIVYVTTKISVKPFLISIVTNNKPLSFTTVQSYPFSAVLYDPASGTNSNPWTLPATGGNGAAQQ